MKRTTSAGGGSTRKPRGSTDRRARKKRVLDEDAIDIEASELRDVDWDALPRHRVELDPALVEQIRAKSGLRQLTLRVGVEQIEEARRVAASTGLKYQAVLRTWLAEGASRARAARMKAGRRRG